MDSSDTSSAAAAPQRSRLWTRDFSLICLAHFIMTMAFYSTMPVMPLFVEERMHATGFVLGVIVALYTAAAIVSRPFAGFCLDRFGRRAVYLPSYLAFGILFFFYPFMATLLLIGMLRFTHGIAWGFVMGAANTAAVDLIPAARRGEGIGYFGLAMTLAMALGPALGVYCTERQGYETLFILGGVITMLGFCALVFLKIPQVRTARRGFSLAAVLEPTSVPVSTATLTACISFGAVMNYGALYARTELNASAGMFFLMLAAGMACARIFAGKSFDISGPAKAMTWGYIFLITGLVLLHSNRHDVIYYATAFILGVGYGIITPVSQAMINTLVGAARRGAANATMMAAFDLGICTGIICVGVLQGSFGWKTAQIFLIASMLGAAALFRFWALPHYRRCRSAPEAAGPGAG